MVQALIAKLTKSKPGSRICDPTCGSASLLIKAGEEVGSDNFSLYGQEANGSTWALAVMNMFLHGFDNATIRWGDTIRNPKLKEGDSLMKFDTVVANPPFSLDKWGKSDDKGENKAIITSGLLGFKILNPNRSGNAIITNISFVMKYPMNVFLIT